MDPKQRKAVTQKLVRQQRNAPTVVYRYGMTPAEIHKATTSTAKKGVIISKKTRPQPQPKPKPVTRPSKALRESSTQPKFLLDVPSFSVLYAAQYPTPDWFTYKEKADVSVIVPLFRSASVLKDLINSWEFDPTLKTEIIYVDDACPLNSKAAVVSLWGSKSTSPIGRIYCASENQGFATSCNIGAYHATGEYLVFLNADTIVTPNWLKPIIRLLKKPEVGIVGNLQIKHGGQWAETIDSAGSQWDWKDKAFLHIGKDIYDHHRIRQPLRPDYCPPDLLETQEREMVTGACLAIRKELYDEVGGFNPNYRVGYWEDADLCLTVREKGYKVMYQPSSKIYHKGHHSGSGGHRYGEHNINYFLNKWVNSGRIDSFVEAPRPASLTALRTILLKRSMASGDVLLAAAIAPALKKRYPGCKIAFTTNCNEVVEGNPFIDRIVKPSEISDRIFQVYYNLDMAYEYRPKTPLLQAYAEMCGVKLSDCELFLQTHPVSGLPDKYVVFHCGNTQWAGRDWSPVKFEILANRLVRRGLNVVCVGSSPDYAIPHQTNFVGRTNMAQLAYIIQHAVCFVGIDSFPMHVAQTFNIPGVCFFGSVDPKTRIIRPNMRGVKADLPCLGCHHRKPAPCTSTTVCEKGIAECINMVTVDSMLKEIEKILAEQGV